MRLVLIGVLGTLGAVVALADNHGDDQPIRPVEIYGCNYNDGKSMSDLVRVNNRWNDWADREGIDNYWAFTMVPIYHSAELEFDVLWIGGWADGAEMGRSMQHWIEKGGALQQEFGRVVDCNVVANFATWRLAEYKNPWTAGLVEFSNCSVAEGRKFNDALGAAREWVSYHESRAPGAGHYMFFPAFGESADADYTFKWVTRYNFESFGALYDMYGTGGGWRKAEQLFDGLLDCDSSRLYYATPVRSIEIANDE